MSMTSLFTYWLGRLRQFGPAQGGNVAITFALASLPMVGLIGAAVDYSRGNSAKASMQAALDATGLTLSKEAQTLNSAQLAEKADKYFKANFNRPEALNIKIVPTFLDLNNGKYQLSLTGTAQIPATLTAVYWKDMMTINSDTKVIWGYKKLELALALDNTGSMASKSKMDQLKIAAKSLVATLEKASKKDGDIKISIVPFNTDVNVGKSFNTDWIRWDEWADDKKNYSCSKSQYDSKWECEDHNGNWNLKDKSTWNGCVWDRNKDNDVKNTTPDKSVKSTRFSAHQEQNCPVEMMPLTSNWTNLNNKIEAMKPVGNTNVTIGMALAFQTLTPTAPFNAAAPSTDLDKVIILLTDGENTENRFGDSTGKIDDRTKLACTNAKNFYTGAQAIKVYTIRVIDGNSSLLQQCATSPSMYYDVQDASQLNVVFKTIASSLASLRLSE